MSSLRNILNSPERVLTESSAASGSAPSTSQAQTEQRAPSITPAIVQPAVPGTPPRPANQTSQTWLRQLVLTPPRPASSSRAEAHKRMTSVGIDELWEKSEQAERRPPQPLPSSSRLLPPLPLKKEEENPQLAREQRENASGKDNTISSTQASGSAATKAPATVKSQQTDNPAEPPVSLEEAKSPLRTKVEQRGMHIGMIIPDVEPEHMHELFGDKDHGEFVYIKTDCGSRYHPRTKKVDASYTVAFDNYFSKTVWVMASDYRAKRAQFHASEIVAYQAELAEVGKSPEYLVQHAISSTDGEKFLKDLKWTEEGVYPLTPEQLDTFMHEISNGKFSGHILESCKLKVESAKVLVEVLPAHNDLETDSEYEESDEERETPSPQGSNEDEVKLRYSVVLKTAPAD